MKDYKYFGVKNFLKTYDKHRAKMEKLGEMFEEQGIDYHDVLDSGAWIGIDSEVDSWVDNIVKLTGEMPKDKAIATVINEETRKMIISALEFFEIPKSYDTAFFMMNYMKTIEGMDNELQTIKERRV